MLELVNTICGLVAFTIVASGLSDLMANGLGGEKNDR